MILNTYLNISYSFVFNCYTEFAKETSENEVIIFHTLLVLYQFSSLGVSESRFAFTICNLEVETISYPQNLLNLI